MRIQSLKISTKALETVNGIESIQEGIAKYAGKTRIRTISFALLATKGPVLLRFHKWESGHFKAIDLSDRLS
jgi:hypothetical protein